MSYRYSMREEQFCQNMIKGMSQTQAAKLAGYSPKTAHVIANENLRKPKIKARLKELQVKIKKTEDDTVASVIERKQVLTQIVRGRFADFMTNLTAEKLRSPALQEVRVVEFKGGKEGRASEKTTTIKLHSPITAIAELNKMEQIYTEGTTVNVDNRQLNIIVEDKKTADLLGEVTQGIKPHES